MTINNSQNKILKTPQVSVILLVYNQSQFLRQALEGLLMQRTSFSYEVIVHDDASTDGSKNIIEEYALIFPHIIYPIYQQENKYSVLGINFVFKYAVSKSKGKYIAMCAGDDYWIDPMKLQKQVDILELNPNLGLTHTKAAKFDQKKNEFNGRIGFNVNNLEELLTENTIVALTVCLRKTLLLQYYNEVKPHKRPEWTTEDFPTWAWFIQHSRIKFLDDYTAVYRSYLGSLSNIKNDQKRLVFSEGVYDVVDYYLSNSRDIDSEKKIRARYYSNMVHMYFLTRRLEGLRNSMKVFCEAKDWLNILWMGMTFPFFFSSFMVKASYKIRSIVFSLFNIYPVKK